MLEDFAHAAAELGAELDSTALSRFRTYRDRIASAGFNLSAVRDPAEIERRHFLESIAFGRLLAGRDLLSGRVLDIGSGAGLPGLAIKIAWPRLQITLLESNGKRCGFLREVITELGLSDIDVLEARAEDAARQPDRREAHDLAIARAVAPLPVLLEYALPFLRLGGHLAAAKGSAAERELAESTAALATLGGRLESTTPFEPPGGLRQTVIFISKDGPTSERYPRRAGLPAKRPID